ncbi:S1 domain-containing RNA-binding protein [Lentilactobacillus kosonis]|uniref:RNA binding protein, contains ribosomal protein S1 domain n=1 Tax=Lentilactobacillus kosonis TaxID=2810561 RepID=A0A401FPG8_9LACO|nr:S1 domain-containing RNA-binding protein [Lentilactobacillus kosonis]GAY74168.1 RNA binding protein, contains ribosomal protein S1 domain [Lentilactobacillus kosonis]
MAIEIGEKVSGKVSGITNFGAFVDLGDHKTGLVHISEVSDGFVKDIHDILKVGDEVTVKVLKVDGDNKISLSIRKANENHDNNEEHSHSTHERSNSGFHHENHNEHRSNNGGRRSFDKKSNGNNNAHKSDSFDDLMSGFLKQSEDRLATLKKNTEGKRGGRGGRRS